VYYVLFVSKNLDFYSRPYLSNGRAIGMVVVRMSVCNGCTVVNRLGVGENFLHECKISAIYSKGNIFILEVEWSGGRKACVFQRKTGHLRNGGRYGLGYYWSLIGSGI